MENEKSFAQIAFENYYKARENVVKVMNERYGLVETYRNEEELHMENDNYLFNYIFITPYADELYVLNKNNTRDGDMGISFQDIMYRAYPNNEEASKEYKTIFSTIRGYPESDRYSEYVLTEKFISKSRYIIENIHNLKDYIVENK